MRTNIVVDPAMTALRRTLTKEEFEQLLKRAAERHTLAEPRDFTVDELVEAGAELGIDALTVQEVHREHELDRQRSETGPPARQKPLGSKLELHKDGDTLYLDIPPTIGRTSAHVVTAGVAGMAATVASMDVPTPLLATIGMLAGLTAYLFQRRARSRQELRLRRDGSGLYCRFVGGRGKGIPLVAGQVHARHDSRTVGNMKTGHHQYTFLALDHGTETYELLVGRSHAEQAWAVDEIERWLGHR